MLLPDLDLRPGIGVQSAVLDKFGLPITLPIEKSFDDFVLVISFGRCKFRLTEESVGKILQATIGGNASDFRTVQIDDRVFAFSVTAKAVGLHIYQLRSYECVNYKLFFHLWGQGGASWTREIKEFEQVEENSWQQVQRRKSSHGKEQRKSYADVVRQKEQRQPVFSRITFPRVSAFHRISPLNFPRHEIREKTKQKPVKNKAGSPENRPRFQNSKSTKVGNLRWVPKVSPAQDKGK